MAWGCDGVIIGAKVVNGTAGSVLYIDSLGKLAEHNPGFTYTTAGGVVLTPTGAIAVTANKAISLKAGQRLMFDDDSHLQLVDNILSLYVHGDLRHSWQTGESGGSVLLEDGNFLLTEDGEGLTL